MSYRVAGVVVSVCEIPPGEIGPKNAWQLPTGEGTPHNTPVKLVSPVCVHPLKSPVSKLPFVTRLALAESQKPKAAAANTSAGNVAFKGAIECPSTVLQA